MNRLKCSIWRPIHQGRVVGRSPTGGGRLRRHAPGPPVGSGASFFLDPTGPAREGGRAPARSSRHRPVREPAHAGFRGPPPPATSLWHAGRPPPGRRPRPSSSTRADASRPGDSTPRFFRISFCSAGQRRRDLGLVPLVVLVLARDELRDLLADADRAPVVAAHRAEVGVDVEILVVVGAGGVGVEGELEVLLPVERGARLGQLVVPVAGCRECRGRRPRRGPRSCRRCSPA